jgi:hypothetical protein
MLTCPGCNRKLGVDVPINGIFTMTDHENYLKNGKCPESGHSFVNRGYGLERVPEPGQTHTRKPDLRLAALMAILAHEGRPRRW